MNKTWYCMILALAITAGCSTTTSVDDSEAFADADLSSSREVVLSVHGLSCPLCSNNLDGQLAKVEGVEGASVDLKTGAVTVRLTEGHSVTSAKLADAVKNAGFTLKAIEPGVSKK